MCRRLVPLPLSLQPTILFPTLVQESETIFHCEPQLIDISPSNAPNFGTCSFRCAVSFEMQLLWNYISRPAFFQAACDSKTGTMYPKEVGIKLCVTEQDVKTAVYLPIWKIDSANFLKLRDLWKCKQSFPPFPDEYTTSNANHQLHHAFLKCSEVPRSSSSDLLQKVRELTIYSKPQQVLETCTLVDLQLSKILAEPASLRTVAIYQIMSTQ